MAKLDQAGLDMWTPEDQRKIADELVRQRCENSSLLEQIDQLRTTIDEKDARIAELESENERVRLIVPEVLEAYNDELCSLNEAQVKRIIKLEATQRELVDALEKLLSVTRHLGPCAGTVDEVEVVLDKLRNQK